MSGISSHFLDDDINQSPVLEYYRNYFLDYSVDKWSVATGDGAFMYITDDGMLSMLYVLDNGKGGISVRYDCAARREGFYSVGSVESMGVIIDAGDDQFAPAGSFVAPSVAWMAVEDFFAAPLVKSERLEWMDVSNIDWLE